MKSTFIIAKENNVTETELAAILLYYQTSNASFSWSNTIGINNLSPNKTILAAAWFKGDRIQNAMHFIKKEIENENQRFDVGTGQTGTDKKINNDNDVEITADNVKQILERELKGITDPAKRADIIMKIGEYVGIKNSDQDDPLTPTIYLPARCSQCKQLKTNAL